MPLIKRLIEPVCVGRTPLHKQVKNELEGVTINSLAGVIKQLSSISKHAEDLFGELVTEAGSIYQRSTALGQRLQILYEKTSQFDSTVREEVKIEEFGIMSHFKSRRQEKQQVLTLNSLPLALKEVYSSCDEPPDLNKFTPYHKDGKDGIKLYTDRNYFYDLWVQQQNQLLKNRKSNKRRRRKHRDNNPSKKIHGVRKKSYASVDKEFVTADLDCQLNLVNSTPASGAQQPSVKESRLTTAPPTPPAPPSQAQLFVPTTPPPPLPPAVAGTGNIPPTPQPAVEGTGNILPPPPPVANSPSFQHNEVAPFPCAAPPPPPPSPMAVEFGGPPATSLPAVTGISAPPPPPMAGSTPPSLPGPAQPLQAPPVVKTPELDARSDLLTAIKMGKNLRNVERNDEEKKQVYGSDVASILMRRVFMVSDTESESGSDFSGSWSAD